MVKNFFTERGIKYEEANVMEGDNMKRLQSLTGQMTVPATEITQNEKTSVVTGYNRSKLAEALKNLV